MEEYYKEALSESSVNQPDTSKDLEQEVATLSSLTRGYEDKIQKLESELRRVDEDKSRVDQELKQTRDQLTGAAEAFTKLQSDQQSIADTQSQVDGLQTLVEELQSALEVSKQEAVRQQEAKQEALDELLKANRLVEAVKPESEDSPKLSEENAALRLELKQANSRVEQLSVADLIVPTHSTPRGAGNPSVVSRSAAEMYDGTRYSDQDLSGDVTKLRSDMDALQDQYNTETSSLRAELAAERRNVDELRQEMHTSFNSSNQSLDSTNIAGLTEVVSSLQATNDRLNADKQELNKALVEQERLCEKLHERLAATDSLSSGVQDTFAKQLSAANQQRDEILQQLEEACRVNAQMNQLVTERNTLQQERAEVKVKQIEHDDLEVELLKMKTQLQSLTHSHHKMSENLAEKDKSGLEMSKRNSILESAVKQMEAKLKDSELAIDAEKQMSKSKIGEVIMANKQKADLEQRLNDERTLLRNRLTSQLEQTKAASEKNSVIKIRQERMEVEDKYNQAIARLRAELADESQKRQDSLKSKHATEVNQLETQHKKQVKFVSG